MNKEKEYRHQCLIYEGSPSEKLPVLAEIIKQKLEGGYRCLYLNSPTMVAGMGSTLSAAGVDVTKEVANGRLILSSEQTGTVFNPDLMLENLERTLDKALNHGYKGLWASGDMTWEFGARRDFSRLLDYELKLEELFSRRKELCGICQYHRDSLPNEVMRQSLVAHPGITVNDTLSHINPYYLKTSWPPGPDTLYQMDEMINSLCVSHRIWFCNPGNSESPTQMLRQVPEVKVSFY